MNRITYADVPFFYRVSKNPDFQIPVLGPIIKCSENYWSFGDGKARVVSAVNHSFKTELKSELPQSWFITALKIMAVVTVVPILLLGIKLASRYFRPVVYEFEPLRTPSPALFNTPPTRSPSFSGSSSSEQYTSSPSPDLSPGKSPSKSPESDSEEDMPALEEAPKDKQSVEIKTDADSPYVYFTPQKKHVGIDDNITIKPIPKKIRNIGGFFVNERGSVTLSTTPVHLARMVKDETEETLWKKAKAAYESNKIESAMVYYIDYALITQRDDLWTSKGEKAIRRALELHEKFYEKDLFPNIEIPRDKFFALVKYIRDVRELTDAQVQKKINAVPELTERPPLNVPIVALPADVKPVDESIGPYRAAVHSRRNMRAVQEDRYLMTEFTIKQEGQKPVNAQLFSVFDGHGGEGTAEFLRQNLAASFKKQLNDYENLEDASITNAIIHACVELNEQWLNHPDYDNSGSTATGVVIIKGTVWFFNVGDSRSIISCDNQVVQGSEDAKASSHTFLNGLLKRGGTLTNHEGWRVEGESVELAVSRAFGDKETPGITARPDILKCELYRLNPAHNNFVVIASDGLWDVFGSRDASNLINMNIPGLRRKPTVEELAYYLTETAAEHMTHDNCTAMTVNLTPQERPAAAASPKNETLTDEKLSVENSPAGSTSNGVVGE